MKTRNMANDQKRNTDQPMNEYGKRSAKKHGSANERIRQKEWDIVKYKQYITQ